jgi:hypothetical protein
MDAWERLLIERECERLLVRLLRLADFGAGDEVAELFAPDGTLAIPLGRAQGLEQLRAVLLVQHELPERTERRVLSNLLLRVRDADRAEGTAYVTVYSHEGAPVGGEVPLVGPQALGMCSVRFVSTPAGWRLADCRIEPTFAREDWGSD